jgi:hypothetical protein
MRHCTSIRVALHKIAMLMPLPVHAATQWRPVILPDDPVSIDGCQPFAGVTPILTPMQKDSP